MKRATKRDRRDTIVLGAISIFDMTGMLVYRLMRQVLAVPEARSFAQRAASREASRFARPPISSGRRNAMPSGHLELQTGNLSA